MLTITNQNRIATLIGIDPGTDVMGVSVFEFDAVTLKLLRIRATSYKAAQLLSDDWIGEFQSSRHQRIHAHMENLKRIFWEEDPVAVISESPFINMKMPGAFAALVEVVSNLRNTLYSFCPWKSLYLVEPSRVKQAVGAKGNANKDGVKEAVRKNKEIIEALDVSIDLLTPDAVDSIAVGYHLFCTFRDNKIPLI
jgi:Holliday junction resolvasome RuvABC endonuclease subunit